MTATSNTRPHMPSDAGDGLVAGDQIGRYQLISLLASGGMGQVWLARPTGPGFARTVALKLVRSEMSGDENYARMFIDEATVASSIHHPNVCETYELGRHADRLYMAMEWIAGDSLAGLLRQGDRLVALDLRIAARIIADSCAGLHAAHETVGPDGALLGVVHRDISPPNILISMQGQAKVSDFGIAKARYQLHERTKTGEVKGKFAYIPPEQISGRGIDRRADIYAMGCVLYVATLGSRPFGNGAGAIRKILLNEYQAPSALRPDYPPALEAIVKKALSANPDARFETAEEMQLALEEWLVSTGRRVTTSDVAKCVRERLSSEIRARNEALMSQNRIGPELLLSRLNSDQDNETPTAGSGMTSAPPSLWRGKPLPSSPRNSDPGDPDDESNDSLTLTMAAAESEVARSAFSEDRPPIPARPLVPARPSDATALVDFVPVGKDAPRSSPAARAQIALEPTPPPDFRRSSFAARLFVVALLVVMLLVVWRLLQR